MTREEAIRRLRYIRMDYLGYPPFLEPIDMAIEALSTDRPMGEWIKRGTKITCSHCKSAWSASFDTIIVGMKYCPCCGAKMGGDDE